MCLWVHGIFDNNKVVTLNLFHFEFQNYKVNIKQQKPNYAISTFKWDGTTILNLAILMIQVFFTD